MSRNTGGPAFPVNESVAGMSLRDFFAAKALPSILAQEDGGIQSYSPSSHLNGTSAIRAGELWAEQAYQMADFMLAERAK